MRDIPLEILWIIIRYLDNSDFYSLSLSNPRYFLGILTYAEFSKRFIESGPLTNKKIRYLINNNHHKLVAKLAIEGKIKFYHGDLYAAVENNRVEMVKVIVKYGLGTFDNMHLTCAIKAGNYAMTKYLCEVVKPRQNALFVACKFGHQIIIEYLLENHSMEPDDRSYIETAILNGHLIVARFLLNSYSYQPPITTFNKTVRAQDIIMLRFLHEECGINPDQRSMHIIISNQDLVMFDYLLDTCDYTLQAAHLVEIFENNDSLTEYVRAKEANIRISRDDRSINACYRDGNIQLIRYLNEVHNLVPDKGEWLKVAYEDGNFEKIKYLVSQIILDS